MRKFLSLMLTLLLLFGIVGCKNNQKPQNESSSTTFSSESFSKTSSTTSSSEIGSTASSPTSSTAESSSTSSSPTSSTAESSSTSSSPPASSAESSSTSSSPTSSSAESSSTASSAESSAESAVIDENGSYTSKDDVALYIHVYGHLPSNFITKKEAEKLGWSGGSLESYAPEKCIGGDRFGNYEGLLPKKTGRSYTECDIDTLGKKSRGAKRIVFSNDGLIYYTDDHYASFELLYGEE